MWTGLEAVF